MSLKDQKVDLKDAQHTILSKIVFIGDSGSGKTSLIRRQVKDEFEERHLATIGVDFMIKTYDLGLVKVKAQFWDSAGQERYRSMSAPYYRNAHGICVCFDLSNRTSFENLQRWIKEIENYNITRDKMILIGCKSDKQPQIATDEIILFAQQKDIKYFQTSALLSQGVSEAFQSIVLSIAQRQVLSAVQIQKQQSQNKRKQVPLDCVQQKKKGCC